MGSAGGEQVTPTATRFFRRGEFREFTADESRFIYVVPAGAIFELDDAAAFVLNSLADAELSLEELTESLAAFGLGEADAVLLLTELAQTRAILAGDAPAESPQNPPPEFPLQSLVLNLTNQCNLSCTYCYEYGADKVATPEGKPKFMDFETARAAVDMLFAESGGRRGVHITFFGGETLMNFPLLESVVNYANDQAAALGRHVDFSLTTNATLLTPAIIAFLSTNRIGVTVSMDGPPEMHNALRVFANGRGSYDIVAPKVRELLAKHRTRPIAARVTLTSGVTDARRIYQHLKHELGFHEVGFAPVTTSSDRLYAIGEPGMDRVFDQFRALAEEYLEYALRGELHGFSNVSDTLAELYQGVNKSHPCGAGLGLMGVGPSGDIAPCHRFVDSDTHALGNVADGIDRTRQQAFLDRGHVERKHECQTCFARPLCAGGCHHEAYVRYGDTGHPNLHYCDWIREWTDLCLRIYGTLSARNPEFLENFAERKGL
jgi:uncharacterized protein